jgi:hypothetical protein
MSPPAARDISRVCRVLELMSKSVYYYQSRKDDQPVEAALRQKAEEQPRAVAALYLSVLFHASALFIEKHYIGHRRV